MSNQHVTVTWEVDDGYCGGRPQHLEIPLDEYLKCNTDKEREDLVEEYVKDAFESEVSYFVEDVEVPEQEQEQDKD